MVGAGVVCVVNVTYVANALSTRAIISCSAFRRGMLSCDRALGRDITRHATVRGTVGTTGATFFPTISTAKDCRCHVGGCRVSFNKVTIPVRRSSCDTRMKMSRPVCTNKDVCRGCGTSRVRARVTSGSISLAASGVVCTTRTDC